jgi:methylmalonyl-CoA mutase N-terminal domain/subunit
MVDQKDITCDKRDSSTFETWSGYEVKRVYGPQDLKDWDYDRHLGEPGEYPFTRGIHETMYRGKHWIKRFFAGVGNASDTNERFKFLISHGETGIITPPDQPGQAGVDALHPLAEGHVGVSGCPFSVLGDMQEMFKELPLYDVNVSLQWGTSPGIVAYCAYVTSAEKMGFDISRLRGSILMDAIGHYAVCFRDASRPLKLGVKLKVDLMEYCNQYTPNWYPFVICGHDIRETGITAPQEIAFCLSTAIAYAESAIQRGLAPDDFLPRLVLSVGLQMDLFEEIAKLRAARRVWARIAKERLGAKDPKSWKLVCSVKTSGSSLTLQQPANNIIRTTVETLAAVLGGAQSIEPCGYDEVVSIPSEEAGLTGMNIHHILAHEARLPNTVDPLGGSYYMETLTNKLEDEIVKIMDTIDGKGGIVKAYESGWVEGEMAREALRYQTQVENKERVIVGVNDYVVPKDKEVPIKTQSETVHRDLFRKSEEMEEDLRRFKENRNQATWKRALENLRENAVRDERENLAPWIIEALKAGGTIGEIMGMMRQAYGASYDPCNMIESPI